jgi:ADP-heptose:LPS heptosyltransferase
MSPSNEPIRIAVFRALQLGDMLCAVPALQVLRGAYPRARITLIGLPWAAELVARYPELLDEHVDFPSYPGITERPLDPGRLAEFVARAAADPPDLAVQLHGSGVASNGFVALLGARNAIGAYRPGTWRPGPGFIPYADDLSEVDRLLAVLEANGIQGDGRMHFPIGGEDRAQLSDAVPGLVRGAYVCIHPGARDPRRRWPAERFAAVVEEVVNRGHRVLLTGLAEDGAVHDEVLAHVGRRLADGVESLAGRLGLGAFGALLEGARLVVSNDTGASHLAAAVGAPSVVVYTASDPARWAPPDRVLHRALGGPVNLPHSDHCCLGDSCARHAMQWQDIPVADVLQAVHEQRERGVRHAA